MQFELSERDITTPRAPSESVLREAPGPAPTCRTRRTTKVLAEKPQVNLSPHGKSR